MPNSTSASGTLWAINSQDEARSTEIGSSTLYSTVVVSEISISSCTFREAPRHKGDNVFPPASFPPTPVIDLEETASDAAEMRNEDLEEVGMPVEQRGA